MLNLVVLVLLTVFLYFSLKKILFNTLLPIKDNAARIKSEYEKLISENAELKSENIRLHNILEGITALYDITKQICRSLDADKVFGYFKEEIDKYVRVSACQFLKSDANLAEYKDYIVLPLEIEKSLLGYLVVKGIAQEDKDKFHILAQQFILGIKRAILYQNVQALAITDSLTQIYSRRYYLERFHQELERSRKYNYNFSCLMIDIDHFKDYNDRYGHLVGDAILKEISGRIKENIRQIDLFGRYGGEEFSIILIETNKKQAAVAAERIRQAIENRSIRIYDEELTLTVSIGVSGFPQDGKELQVLIERADTALYQAKQTGRNRVCLSEAP